MKKKIFISGLIVIVSIFMLTDDSSSSTMGKATVIGSTTVTSNATAKMPDQSYIGTWYTADGKKEEDLTISEITNDTIKFNLGIFRLASIDGTATISGNEIKFVAIDPAGNNLYGTLKFSDNTIYFAINQQNWIYALPKELTFTDRE